jgi:ATP-dependent protease ClpP protease subunit
MEQWYTITGQIDANTAHQLTMWINNQLYNGTITKLRLIISSGGGDMDSAIRAYSYLKAAPFEVETIAFSQIDSAANIIYLSGSNRVAIKGCRFLFHEGIFTIGLPNNTLHNHEENLRIFTELNKKHIDILSSESGQTRTRIEEMLKNGEILTTETAKELGFVHEIKEKLPLNSPRNPAQ